MQVSALIAFLGGALTLFAPCAAMLLPSFFAYAFSSSRVLLARTAVFAVGVILALLPFGAFAGSFGVFLRTNSTTFSVVAGALVLILGVMQIFSLAFPVPKFASSLMTRTTSAPAVAASDPSSETESANSAPSALAVFLLGLGYALAGVGCSGPILGAVLAYGSLNGSVFGGIMLMVWYGLGMAFPVALLALLWDSLGGNQRVWLRPRPLQIFGRWTTVMNVVSGTIFIILGLILMVFNGHVGLPSILSGEQQIQLESSVAGAFAAVPGWLFVALFGVILALVVLKFKSSK
ncbi:cytochrome C biogenesis protein transmembrane region [Gleimia coleocanis DSM 15436]|uniref:Cytochrome C biogenesis protein transmembrane region n=1 Tax=Gleimia coleocanis DSM 15436 TaxID=525245 RepID=C0W215_9ACTO|nr:cytochrome c biogenesis CcdA family protein [Gleimia coleocanis]EEH63229.1 cytochrome C biogenesis protein transmembrane region [Gleimia coleocanis DSM 15436]